MSATNVYLLHSLTLDTTASIPGIISTSFSNNPDIMMRSTDASLYGSFAASGGGAPSASFTTIAIDTAIEKFSILGQTLTDNDITMYAKKLTSGSGRASGAVHTSYNFDAGIVYPTSLSVNSGGDAEISYNILPISSDGSTHPVTYAHDATLLASATDDERFTIGPVDIGGVELDNITSININFGVSVMTKKTDSDLYPTFAYIERVEPTITITGIDPTWLTDGSLAGFCSTHATSSIYLRRRMACSTYYADDATGVAHMKFTVRGMAALNEGFSASGHSNGTASITLKAFTDGTNAPILVTRNSAIT